jgi:phage tail sheath protein FI
VTAAIVADGDLVALKDFFTAKFDAQLKQLINEQRVVLPPSAAVAGIYCMVDNSRGVWKAPANVSLARVLQPMVTINDESQRNLNVDDVSGKSINAIRTFTGKGHLVWGARTLDAFSDEWRYVSVRRLFNMVEESLKKASGQFVFEPNDANLWVKVKAMCENFLNLLWRQGALFGSVPAEAFRVKVGLGETMDENDINNGRLIISIEMAPVRPAEFIVLRFMHKMQTA